MPIVDIIKNESIDKPRILDVGSGSNGFSKYIKYPVIGLDCKFNGNIANGLRPVLGDGMQLPFRDKSFDYVLSIDNLEHIPAELRPVLISEVLRVARRKVFLAVPCNGDAAKQDRKLDTMYLERHGERFPFLTEHVDFGLPSEGDILGAVRHAVNKLDMKKCDITVTPNVNLRLRYMYMSCWISRNKQIQRLYQLMIVLMHFRKFLNFGKCYRKIFVIKIAE